MLPEAAVGDGGPHPGLHVGGGRDDLGAGHLLHLLQSLLPLGGVQVGMGTLAGHLQRSQSDPTQVERGGTTQNQGRECKGRQQGLKGLGLSLL